MKDRFKTDVIGWTGTVLILAAYIATVSGVLAVHSGLYLVANIFGSAGIIYNSYLKKDLEPVVLNIIWLLVALISLLRLT